jgi:hypothetical protein
MRQSLPLRAARPRTDRWQPTVTPFYATCAVSLPISYDPQGPRASMSQSATLALRTTVVFGLVASGLEMLGQVAAVLSFPQGI